MPAPEALKHLVGDERAKQAEFLANHLLDFDPDFAEGSEERAGLPAAVNFDERARSGVPSIRRSGS